MARGLYRSGIGVMSGAGVGLIAFESVTILFFAFGQFGTPALTAGLLAGICTGSVFGPGFALLRPSWRRAALWEAGLLCLAHVGYAVWMLSTGPVFTSSADALAWLLQGLAFLSIAGALAGGGTWWALELLLDAAPRGESALAHRPAAASEGAGIDG